MKKMKKIKKRINVDGVIRIVLTGIAVIAQLILLILILTYMKQSAVLLYFLLEMLSLAGALILAVKNEIQAYTVPWLIIIFMLPVFGFLLYLLWGRTGMHGRKSRRMRDILAQSGQWLKPDEAVLAHLEHSHPAVRTMPRYIEREGFPLYKNTDCRYYELGEMQFEQMLTDLEDAEKFIFLEYFIVAQGKLWERVHEVLRRKAAEGVDVRLFFDDMGSLLVFPSKVFKQLKAENIKVRRFNPVHKNISRFYINYRNHQKIVVIDGNIGYTGGTNLADEYANLIVRYGHWKDTAIRMTGDAVWSLTVIFLQMWESETGIQEDYLKFKPTVSITNDFFFQPFSDGPVNNPANPAENIYLKMIAGASDYVYITTPYLVVQETMMNALCIAAMSGVDVRIITPKIYDHWYVHTVTRSNYGRLMETGVRIYEYTPGYIHSKTIICDGEHAVIGSINMDYRSFYLHFENGVWMCGTPVLDDIEKDINQVLSVSEEICLEQWKSRPLHVKIVQAALRLLIPLF